MATIPLVELVEDLAVYPRREVDTRHAHSLAEAIRSHRERLGDPLARLKWSTPIVVDRKSKRIVDGFHRSRAELIVYGDAAETEVEFRDYKSERALVEDAVSLNASHGKRLDACDIRRAEKMLESHGVPDDRIAVLLHIPKRRVVKMKAEFVTSRAASRLTVPGTMLVPAKPAARHLIGGQMTRQQSAAHDMMPGTSLVLTARQLRAAVESKLIDPNNERLLAELRALHAALGEYLGPAS